MQFKKTLFAALALVSSAAAQSKTLFFPADVPAGITAGKTYTINYVAPDINAVSAYAVRSRATTD